MWTNALAMGRWIAVRDKECRVDHRYRRRDLLLLTSPRCKELDEHCLPRREFIIIRMGELDGISYGGREAE